MDIMTVIGPGVRLAFRGLHCKYGFPFRFHSTAPTKFESKSNTVAADESPGKHVRFTANQTRLPVIAHAVVTDVRMESPTVKGITMEIKDSHFSFRAGQWVDMFIPGLETVGGFSMYSSPSQLVETGTLDLGVKFSKWPPAYWIHSQCKVGSTVALRVGGDFYYDPEVGDFPHDLLLIAGGVGVNPLASMYFHANELFKLHQENNEEYHPGQIVLLYSARTHQDILYKSHLDTIMKDQPKISVKYFTTREQSHSPDVTYGHINEDILRSTVQKMDTASLKSFICGPPPMIESIKECLLACGLSKHQILYEKWW